MWSLKEINSGMTFANPNIPSLQYGRDIEMGAVNKFTYYIEN